jgi:hypothetical protein
MPKHAADEGVFIVAAAAAVVDAAAAAFVYVFESVFVDVLVDVFVFGIVGIIKMRGQPWHTRVWVGIFGIDLLCVTMRWHSLLLLT